MLDLIIDLGIDGPVFAAAMVYLVTTIGVMDVMEQRKNFVHGLLKFKTIFLTSATVSARTNFRRHSAAFLNPLMYHA